MRLVKAKAARKNKKKLAAFRKTDHGKGFTRTKKQWENSFADHVGKFIDRLTFTDFLNIVAFSGGAYATYQGITKAAEVSEAIPDWLKWISPLSPFLYQLVIPTQIAADLSEVDKVVLALLGGYSTVKLAPVVVRAAVEAVPSVIAGA